MRASSRVLVVKDRQGAVLMDISAGLILNLNHVGSIIWQELRAGHSSEEIASRLAADFAIPHERASADINKFLQQLEAQQLLCTPEARIQEAPKSGC